jgi:hypothetical protein
VGSRFRQSLIVATRVAELLVAALLSDPAVVEDNDIIDLI